MRQRAVRAKRRAPERRQVGLWEFFRWERKGIYRARRRVCGPGPAYGLVLLGDPPSFDEDDSDPHVCVMPCDAVAVPSLAVTCGVSHSTVAAGLLFGADGVGVTVSNRTTGMPPWSPRPPRSPRQSRLRSRTSLVPSCPASRQMVSRSRRTAVFGCSMPPVKKQRILVDSPPPPFGRVAHPCRRGASPHAIRDTCASELRGTSASAATSYDCPANAGFPPAVRSPGLSEWPPTPPPQGGSIDGFRIAPAPKRHHRRVFSSLAAAALHADLAPRHYRISATANGRRTVVTGPVQTFRPRDIATPRMSSRCALRRRFPDSRRAGLHSRSLFMETRCVQNLNRFGLVPMYLTPVDGPLRSTRQANPRGAP